MHHGVREVNIEFDRLQNEIYLKKDQLKQASIRLEATTEELVHVQEFASKRKQENM